LTRVVLGLVGSGSGCSSDDGEPGSLRAGAADRSSERISSYRVWRGLKSRLVKLFGFPRTASLKREVRVVEPVHF